MVYHTQSQDSLLIMLVEGVVLQKEISALQELQELVV
jgi:hypothetical protein